jgi:pimeloyl-ACP methyl ester carboxylesterase
MKRKGIFLSGYACTSQIWQPVMAELDLRYEIEPIDWPLDLTAGFHCIDDFASWLYEHHWPRTCDFIVGHSMGGLVALRLGSVGAVDIQNIILMETFLSLPSPFFQNMLMPDAPPCLKETVSSMTDSHEGYYSRVLRDRARKPQVAPNILPSMGTIHAIYGDRGCSDRERVIAELGWPDTVRSRISVSLVPRACHFPMLEQPEASSVILSSQIG